MNTGSDEAAERAAEAGAHQPESAQPSGTPGASEPPGSTAAPTSEEDAKPLGSRAPEFVQARRALHLSWQVGVFVVGLAVVVAGIVMLPLPGPGWLVIFGGMAIWATEFVWAQLVLRWTKRKVTEAAQRALDPRVRRRNIILTTVGLVIIAVLVGIYVWKFGLEMPWNIKE
ncbi:TIGR02611 family protein [Streptomyces sp. SID5785]|uniref:TIGR02611 family protein n=1 Tax=Streptomyces sp. SID5785 TaxID=2690309 RepID=UPI00136184FB|nr:TIGR02611 family protein [Streptomyces sp. SID5785]MZD08232.1 TIGR02611 family protein [Streptomyces sp. SID5785]